MTVARCMMPVLLLLLLVAGPFRTCAQDTQKAVDVTRLFAEANLAYKDGRYETAAGLYEQLIAAGYATGHLYYNLGNAFYKSGALGKAILNYRRALLLMPRDEDIQSNLAYAIEQTTDKLQCSDLGSMLKDFCFWYTLLTEHELLALFLVVHALFWISIAIQRFNGNDVAATAMYVCLFLTLVFGLSFAVKTYNVHIAPDAVVIPHEITVRAGTSINDTPLFKLHEGTVLRWKEESEGWVKIELCDGKKGWVYKDTIARLSLASDGMPVQ